MKPLVVFYSRTGTTKKVAETISSILKCDVEEVFDTKNRAGVLGWLRSGRDAGSKKLTAIDKAKKIQTLHRIFQTSRVLLDSFTDKSRSFRFFYF